MRVFDKKVLAFFGYSNSGKTAILTEITSKLSEMGYRVGVIKHSDKNFQVDVEGKDSYRLFNAGADVFILSPVKMAFHTHQNITLESAVNYLDDCDIILAEGFKESFQDGVVVVKNKREFDELIRQINNTICSSYNQISRRLHLVICSGDNLEDFKGYRVVSSKEIDKIVDFVIQYFKKV